MECKAKGSCEGAAKIRGNSKQTQNIGKGGKGTLSNKGKRRKRSPDDLEFMPESIDSQTQNVKTGGQGAVKNVHNKGSKNTGPIQHIGRQTQNVAKGAHGLIHNQLNNKKRGKRSASFIGIPFLVNFFITKSHFLFPYFAQKFLFTHFSLQTHPRSRHEQYHFYTHYLQRGLNNTHYQYK